MLVGPKLEGTPNGYSDMDGYTKTLAAGVGQDGQAIQLHMQEPFPFQIFRSRVAPGDCNYYGES